MVIWMFAFMFGLIVGVAFCNAIRQGFATVGAFFTYVKDNFKQSEAGIVNP